MKEKSAAVKGGAGASPAFLVRPNRITPTDTPRATIKPIQEVHEQSDEPIPGIPVRKDMAVWEEREVLAWRRHWRETDGSSLYLSNLKQTRRWMKLRPRNSSRYHPEGRKRAQRRVLRAWGDYTGHVVMLTLTFDPKVIDRMDAWGCVTKDMSRVLDALWVWRKRHGKGKKPRPYVWCLEEQPGTGYPHIHLLVCDTWLAPAPWLEGEWGHGRIEVKQTRDSVEAGKYIARYVGKMRGWSDNALAHIWRVRARMYGISRQLSAGVWVKRPAEWKLAAVYSPSRGLARSSDDGWDWLGVWRDDWHILAGPGHWCEDDEQRKCVDWEDCA